MRLPTRAQEERNLVAEIKLNRVLFLTISRKTVTLVWTNLLFLGLLFLSALSHGQEVKDIAPRLVDAITKSGKKTVAVVDFTDLQGRVTELGRFLADEVSVDLVSDAKNFDVIDRANLKTLLQEHKLASTGIIDPQTTRRVGEIAGVQALVTGLVAPFGDNVRLSIKVLDSETAKMISGLAVDIPRNKAIDELLTKTTAPGDLGGRPQSDDNSRDTNRTPHPMAKPVVVEVKELMSDFEFTFRMCLKTEDKVECTGQVANKSSHDSGLGFDTGGTYFVDNLGNQARGVTTRLGSGRENEGQVLPPGIPITFSISASGISSDASAVSLYLVTNRANGTLRSFPLQAK